MRKYSTLFLSAMAISAGSLFLSSCKDDEPPVKPKLSFGAATLTAKESDANLLVEVVLDKAASEDITIDYSLDGTALDEVAATNNNADYTVVGDYGEVTIEKGETTGTIELEFFSDGDYEDDETIEISIDKVSSEDVEITRDDEMAITLAQEDGLVILLEWPASTTVEGQVKQADMDIVVRYGTSTTTWTGVLNAAASEGFTGSEFVFIPKAVTAAAYGVSYVYYEGTLDPLEFTATFIEFANGALEAEAQTESFEGSYTEIHKNKWTDINTTKVVQTFTKTGDAFSSPTVITPAAEGSRVGSSDNFKSTLKKERKASSSYGPRVNKLLQDFKK